MWDPCIRLERRSPGERCGEPARLVARLDTRSDRKVRDLPVRDRSVFLPDTTFRNFRRAPDAAPNAPLLIRIVKFPYGMSPARAERLRVIEVFERRARDPVGHPLQEGRQERTRPLYASPTSVHIRHARLFPCDVIRSALEACAGECDAQIGEESHR